MNAAGAAEARQVLLRRRDALVHRQRGLDADATALGAERRGEELAENDEIAGVLVLVSDRETAELREVEGALRRLEAGTWGRCERCGEAIAPGRMRARPEARTCASCEAP